MPRTVRVPRLSSVFRYLSNAIKYFRSQQRPDLMHAYEDALEVVGEMIYGVPDPYSPKVVTVVDVPCPVGHRVPPWKEQLLSRPLRKIVNVKVEREQNEYTGAWVIHWLEELECGHVNTHYPFMPDEKRARRRRCRACQSKTRFVQSIVSAKPAPGKSTLCTSAPRAVSSSTSAEAVASYSMIANGK
jgi:hypothetical protein